MNEFQRRGPLRAAASYPQWMQQLLNQCQPAKQLVVEHELFRRMAAGKLGLPAMRLFLIGTWPVIEQFPLYMAQNLLKTRAGRQRGEDMARRYLVRNIRVEQNHADYWQAWAECYGITMAELQAQQVPPEMHALSHWCWHCSASDELLLAMAATNYAIEGATGEWSQRICTSGRYEASLPEARRKRSMKWLKLHAHYDDDHPWEALDIICTLAGEQPSSCLQYQLQAAICKSYSYMLLILDRCLQLEASLKPPRHAANLA